MPLTWARTPCRPISAPVGRSPGEPSTTHAGHDAVGAPRPARRRRRAGTRRARGPAGSGRRCSVAQSAADDPRHEVDREQPGARLAGDAEGHAAGALLLVAVALALAQAGGAEPLKTPSDGVRRARPSPSGNDLVAGRRRTGQSLARPARPAAASRRAAPGVGEQQVDDVGSRPRRLERPALPGGRAAAARAPARSGSLTCPSRRAPPAAGAGRRPAGRRRRRPAAAGRAGQVEEVALQPGAGGPPERGAQHRRPGRHGRLDPGAASRRPRAAPAPGTARRSGRRRRRRGRRR